MLAVLVAAAALAQWSPAPRGACPTGYTAEKQQRPDGFFQRRCVDGTDELKPKDELKPESDVDLSDKAFLCQPSTTGFECCFSNTQGFELRCDDAPKGYQDLCTSTEIKTHSTLGGHFVYISVWCEDDPLPDESINWAETGAVAVGGAIGLTGLVGPAAVYAQ